MACMQGTSADIPSSTRRLKVKEPGLPVPCDCTRVACSRSANHDLRVYFTRAKHATFSWSPTAFDGHRPCSVFPGLFWS